MIANLNGVAVAYAVGVTNAAMAMLFSFGVNINADQRTAIVGFVNAALVLTAHLSHVQAKKQAEIETSLQQQTPGQT
jgi:hypothetical protein